MQKHVRTSLATSVIVMISGLLLLSISLFMIVDPNTSYSLFPFLFRRDYRNEDPDDDNIDNYNPFVMDEKLRLNLTLLTCNPVCQIPNRSYYPRHATIRFATAAKPLYGKNRNELPLQQHVFHSPNVMLSSINEPFTCNGSKSNRTHVTGCFIEGVCQCKLRTDFVHQCTLHQHKLMTAESQQHSVKKISNEKKILIIVQSGMVYNFLLESTISNVIIPNIRRGWTIYYYGSFTHDHTMGSMRSKNKKEAFWQDIPNYFRRQAKATLLPAVESLGVIVKLFRLVHASKMTPPILLPHSNFTISPLALSYKNNYLRVNPKAKHSEITWSYHVMRLMQTVHLQHQQEDGQYVYVLRIREDAGWLGEMNLDMMLTQHPGAVTDGFFFVRPCLNYGGVSDKVVLSPLSSTLAFWTHLYKRMTFPDAEFYNMEANFKQAFCELSIPWLAPMPEYGNDLITMTKFGIPVSDARLASSFSSFNSTYYNPLSNSICFVHMYYQNNGCARKAGFRRGYPFPSLCPVPRFFNNTFLLSKWANITSHESQDNDDGDVVL